LVPVSNLFIIYLSNIFFSVDTTGAGEGNLEVIIKDGYDTLKAQLLKREKRKFEIGFVAERNMKHDVQVIFNGLQIKGTFPILLFFFLSKTYVFLRIAFFYFTRYISIPIA
jgi:hypothetical protein